MISVMAANSNVFSEKQRLTGTIFTIVRQARPGSWSDIVCVCDCGKEVVLTYPQAYYKSRYSCGCARRLRSNAVDATGMSFHSPMGNRLKRINDPDGPEVPHGRALQILCRDETTGQWIYLCECCAGTFTMPGGDQPARLLRKIAAENCPNFRPRYYVDEEYHWHSDLEITVTRVLPKLDRGDPENLVPYYANPKRDVVRDKFGTIIAFMGLPDSPEFKALQDAHVNRIAGLRRKDREKRAKTKEKMHALFYGEVVPERPATTPAPATDAPLPIVPEIIEDDFADADYAGYVPYTPPE